ncbi:hypothetical protein [Sagittula sp. S175]|uniref:hypothetical protein n=1 Tax=Sagittula sp. S175 TaxID=3415129 RepID=UPI003C7CBB4A
MNFDQIMRMIVNQVIRQFVSRGVNAGMNKMGQMGQGRSARPRGEQMASDFDVDPQEQQRRQEQQAVRQARRAAREARRNS